MTAWALFGVAVLALALAVPVGRRRERAGADRLEHLLLQRDSEPDTGASASTETDDLPAPVARYFQTVLREGVDPIRVARLTQSGTLRTRTGSERWLPFTAEHLVVPSAPGFVWNARVEMPLATHVRVLDGYLDGQGYGRVSLLSAFGVAGPQGPELDSGALHRYLAEAVWLPTALLPSAGVVWTPIDEHSARATLSDRHTSVSLDFHFNEAGEVIRIFTPGRYCRVDRGYTTAPWEGHFRDYCPQAGIRIPMRGEVGWYVDGALQIVWKGELTDVRYQWGP